MPDFKLKHPTSGEVFHTGSAGERALLLSRGYTEVVDKPRAQTAVAEPAAVEPADTEIPKPRKRGTE